MTRWTPLVWAALAARAAAPLPADLDDDGFDADADCDDLHPWVYPGAPERCDGVDQDCDGAIDEQAADASAGFVDRDGDGVGDDAAPWSGCERPADVVEVGGDCDDDDPTRHPGAPELCDGIDQDCDPTTADAQLASTNGRSYPTVQAAIDAAGTDGVVTVCPGTYRENLIVPPIPMTLTSLGGPEVTVLDGGAVGTTIDAIWSLRLALDGFTVTGGAGRDAAGGLRAVQATVEDCVFEGNRNTTYGGGAMLFGDSTLTRTTFRSNDGFAGGGLYAYGAELTLTECTFEGNHADEVGGAIYLQDSALVATDTTFTANDADGGGAIGATNGGFSPSGVTLVGGALLDNVATGYGGALNVGAVSATGTVFAGNAARNGGAIYSYDATSLDGVVVTDNVATELGGAFVGWRDWVVTDATVTGNVAARGGGFAVFPLYSDGTFTATGGDWGADTSDNLPDDVWVDGPYAVDAALTCDLTRGDCR